jgi:hypothetical protein
VPNRIIREAILTSDKVDELDPATEVFYRRLLSKVDDYGRFDARPSVLRASLYPLRLDRVREADCSRWMAACQKAGLIVLYSHDGKPYLEVVNTGWKARSESRYPALQASANICSQVQTNVCLDVDVDVVVDGSTSASADLLEGVSPQVAKDFKALRQKMRAPLTQTAVDGIKREAEKAGLSLESVLAMCCERGWRGFKAEWVQGQAAPVRKRELL